LSIQSSCSHLPSCSPISRFLPLVLWTPPGIANSWGVKGSGIGREAALAFASAGAAHVALLGRTNATLQETAQSIASTSKASHSVHVADVTKAESLKSAAAAVGKWHILVLCSGYCPKPSPIPSSEEEEWSKGFEVSSTICIPNDWWKAV
jgi:hypothetical protein